MRLHILGALLTGLASLGLQARQPEPAKPPAEAVKTEPVKTEVVKAAPSTPPEITLLEPGAEPRRELRITPKVDQSETCTMRLKMAMKMSMEGQEFPSPAMPEIIMVMAMKILSITPEGDIAYDMSITDCRAESGPDVDPGMAAMMGGMFEPMKRITGVGTVTSRGINKDLKVNIPDDLPETAKQAMSGLTDQMGQIGSPLPAEAIGIGGKWRVKTELKSQGMKMTQTATCTLKEVRDGVIMIETAIEQAAAPQKVETPGVPPGVNVELKSLFSSGSGTTELPLTAIVPRKAALKIGTDIEMKVSQGEQVSSMKQNVKVEMSLASGEAKAEPAPEKAPAPTTPPTTPATPKDGGK